MCFMVLTGFIYTIAVYFYAYRLAFCIKTNLRENRFFATRWAIVDENGTHNVKFLTENDTKLMCNKYAQVGNGTKNM